MDDETVNELLTIKTWLQGYRIKLEQDEQQLNRFIASIDQLVEEETQLEEGPLVQDTLSDVRWVFDDDLRKVLDFSQEGNTIVIQQQQFLERSIWLRINAKVDEINGHWVSDGEASRWEIPINELP